MKHSLIGLCGAGALLLPLSVWAAPEVRDLSPESGSFYQQTEARETTASGSLALFNALQEQQRQLAELRGQIEELRYQLGRQREMSQQQYLQLEQRLDEGAGSMAGELGDGDVNTQGATAVANTAQDGRQAYQAAFQHVQGRDFDKAIAAFEAFINDYPESPLRANGYYWLGELYSSRSELDPAAEAFSTVIHDYPESNKVPDALYKLGLLKARQGLPDESKQLLEQVRQEYPDSNAANMAGDFLSQSGL